MEELRRHSVMLDRKLWENDPIYFFQVLPPHISKYAQRADDASIQAQIDVFGKDNVGAMPGALGPRGNFAAVTFAESFPDRVAMLAYLNEVLSFYECFEKQMTEMLGATLHANPVPKDPKYDNPVWQENYKKTMAKWPKFLEELDPKLGPKCVKALVALIEGIDMEPKMAQYKTMKEYALDRSNYIAWPVACDNAEFGSQLDLTREQMDSVRDIFLPLWIHSCYVYDYYHYDKEAEIHSTYGKGRSMINAVPLLHRLKGLSVEEAKAWLKQRCLELEKEYLHRKEDYFSENPPETVPVDLRRWFLSQEDLATGFAIWCATTYHNHPPFGEGYAAPYEKRRSEGALWFENVTESDKLMTGGFEVRYAN
ncbi:isoprenoid synthase domain-containing protein [Penicillium canariense]|uniref:Isoprenoid synthase domain-containing protein n=1 Tax=Penicillium canariense TaxID=189055 RepID=A0A9W9LKS7_9EURO|nr:isoprenoid synthase domain-containing protein [Penicillium canariense]KAJ5160938.1 isoprenoid synthase domain-containing protein [Penicillium canariense]